MAEIQITEQDRGRNFEAKQGDFIYIHLSYAIGSAYSWKARFDSHMLNLRTIPSYYFARNTRRPRRPPYRGGGGLSTFTFRALRPGTTKIIIESIHQVTKEIGKAFYVTVNIRQDVWPTS